MGKAPRVTQDRRVTQTEKEQSVLYISALGRAGAVSLNPQPLPPKVFNPGGRVSLNPQPLPPRFSQFGYR